MAKAAKMKGVSAEEKAKAEKIKKLAGASAYGTRPEMVVATMQPGGIFSEIPSKPGRFFDVIAQDEKGYYFTEKNYVGNLLDPHRAYHRVVPNDECVARFTAPVVQATSI